MKNTNLLTHAACLTVGLGILAGCTTSPETSPSHNHSSKLPPTTGPKTPPETTNATADQPLTLGNALSRALRSSPKLSAFAWEMRAAEARALQAGLWPNPELELETEKFGGSGANRGFRSADQTASVSQRIRTAGKIRKQTTAAEQRAQLAQWDYREARREVTAKVVRAFADVLAAQERLATARQTSKLAEEMFDIVVQQVEAGEVSPVERNRAQVALSTSQVDLTQARRALNKARVRLAATWGSNQPHFEAVKGALEVPSELPPRADLSGQVQSSPAVARWEDEIQERQAKVKVAQANKYPDVTVNAGVRRFEASDDYAGVASFSLPIPLFDRNQGAIRAAEFALAKAHEQKKQAQVQAQAAFDEAYEELAAAHEEVRILEETGLPAARSAYEATRLAYQEGALSQLNLLDAQRALFDVQFRHMAALAAYHRALAAVYRYTGASIGALLRQKTEDSGDALGEGRSR